jgi:hypothetical protein
MSVWNQNSSIYIEGGTQADLQQVMEHQNAGIFQAYMNTRVQYDVQAGFLDLPSNDALIKAMTHMSRDVDPRAPNKPTKMDLAELKIHPLLVELRERRDFLSAEAKRSHGTIKRAQAARSEIYLMYNYAQLDFESTKKRLMRERMTESRADFFDRIETEDAQRQLDGLSLRKEPKGPEQATELSEDRKLVAHFLCERPSNQTTQEKLEHRIGAINALYALCQDKNPSQRPRSDYSRDWGILPTPEPSPEPTQPKLALIKVTNRECLFCVCKTGQYNSFCRPRKATEHRQNLHLKWFEENGMIPCPDPYCRLSGVVLFGHIHFNNHEGGIHRAGSSPT